MRAMVLIVSLTLMCVSVHGQLSRDLKALKGKTVPDFQLRDLSGKIIKFSQFRGKVILINFWSPY